MKNNNLLQKEKAVKVKRQWVRLTRACNNRCLFCLDNEAQDGSCINFSIIKDTLAKGRAAKAEKAVLSGGEPTLHPELFKIISAARDMGYSKIQVITNGRMFAYQEFLRQAVDCGVTEITFSIHGHTPQLHDQQTQVKGSFDQSVRGLLNARKIKGLVVNADIVINKLNVGYLRQIIGFLVVLGINEFDLLQVMPFGRAWLNQRQLFYDIEKEIEGLRLAFGVRKASPVCLWTNRFPAIYLEGMEDLIQHPNKLIDEVSGVKEMFGKFIRYGLRMPCWGERCRYCCLQGFCEDLIALRSTGLLSSRLNPLCIDKKWRKKAAVRKFKFSKGMDLLKFLDFYLKERYFVKSLRCGECAYNKECQGAHIDLIRKNGFALLSPFKAENSRRYPLLRLTLDCNASCLFCNVPVESSDSKEISTSGAKQLISKIAAVGQDAKIDFTGGEPTIRKDLPKLIRYARLQGIETVQVQTNALKLADKGYLRSLQKAGLNKIFVGLHSFSPSVHDSLLGLPGAFEKCIKGVRNAILAGIEVTLNPVITSRNYKELPDYMLKVATLKKVNFISLSVVQPRGRAGINKDLVPDYKVIGPYVERALLIGNKLGLVINNPYCGLPMCVGGWYNYPQGCVEYCEGLIGRGGKNEDKIKASFCGKCSFNNFCNGVWKEYAKIHGFSGLRPLKLKNDSYVYI
ncbi:MAG: radical SAM protein [Candidatus Omnitrophota bacterium]|jgi:MoaA/NifB/PqqE/SkfB family radical SAM enzyme|nr:radical SAM protein [Candidatus Omnitrophota bacterium]MDD5664812.1 radical SAM protein [Candidatus Omnitrophota bacterium]